MSTMSSKKILLKFLSIAIVGIFDLIYLSNHYESFEDRVSSSNVIYGYPIFNRIDVTTCIYGTKVVVSLITINNGWIR